MKRLTPAKVTLLMLVVVGGLVTAYVAKGLLAREDQPTPIETRRVSLALSDLEPGKEITAGDLGSGKIRVTELEPGTLISRQGIIGRVVRKRILAGTTIQAAELYPPGERPPLEVAGGMVAVSVPLAQSVAMVDGLVQPGQYVNIHFTPTADGNDVRYRGGLTITIFKGVKLLAVNRSIRPTGVGRSRNSVTLELSRRQSNIIILAQKRGEITLSYSPEGKGDGGISAGTADRVTLDEILGLKPLPKPAEPFIAESYKGSGRTEVRFRNGRRIEDRSVGDAPARTSPTTPTLSGSTGS